MSNLQLGYSGIDLVSQGTGYGLLIGLGVFFCGVIVVAIKIQRAYLAEDSGTSEMFMVANRTVGRGLTASAVFSSWMWINETVFAAAMCFRFGIAVPMVSQLYCVFHSKSLTVQSGGEAVFASRLL